MINNIRILVLDEIQTFYRKMVSYCSRKIEKYRAKGKHLKAERWRIRMHKYFIKQCDTALKIIEIAS